MKPASMFGYSALLAIISLLASPALAAYSQPASTFSAGGGESVSATYTNLGVIGQPGIVGNSASTSYTAEHGFLPVLGGWKILYPVISATPGTLTFSLTSGASGNLPLEIANDGGSTLVWSVAKTAADTVFSVSQDTGTNTGSITVTADAVGLAVGSYNNTLTINGAGISETVFVQLDLTVSAAPPLYTLAVTLKQATPGKGGGNITMAIPPAVAVKTCSNLDETCSYDFPANSTVTLAQFPGSDSQWGTWGAPGCGSNPDCQVVLTAPQGTDVVFPYSSKAKLTTSGNGYEFLVSAYGNAATIDTINARAVSFVEGTPGSTILFTGSKTINLVGGLDAFYAPTSGFTTIQNVLKVGGTDSRLNIKGGVKIRQ